MPIEVGIGLKPAHYADVLSGDPALGFLEVHTENYMGRGGPPHRYLERLAERYPLSFHGVGLSLGGSERLDAGHLRNWRALVDRYSPALISEHVAWSSFGGTAFHDLLPLPYTREALDALCRNIDQMQEALCRRILIENPSRYLDFVGSDMPEPDFLVAAATRTGCGLLLDINNVYVSTRNQGEDARDWLAAVPIDLVGEIHLAGHTVEQTADGEVLIDDHGSAVAADVWTLYAETIARCRDCPTLIEWDTNVPALETLLCEASRAREISEQPAARRENSKPRPERRRPRDPDAVDAVTEHRRAEADASAL